MLCPLALLAHWTSTRLRIDIVVVGLEHAEQGFRVVQSGSVYFLQHPSWSNLGDGNLTYLQILGLAAAVNHNGSHLMQ